MKIHFVCRGNSFRSIIAEAYAKSKGDGNSYSSSGTVAGKTKALNAENHRIVLDALKSSGLGSYVTKNWGEQTTQKMLDEADLCVFVNRLAYNEAIELGLSCDNYTCLEIDDFNEGANLKNQQRTLEEVVSKTMPRIFEQVDSLLVKEL